jgi:hypothetical protein
VASLNTHREIRALDDAVFDAYGRNPSMTDEDLLAALLDLNLGRSETDPAEPPGGQGVDEPEDEG